MDITTLDALVVHGPTPAAAALKKHGPQKKLQQQLEQLSRLPKAQQPLVSQLIDTVLQQHAN